MIYICSMYVVYFMHNFIRISSFSFFPHYIIWNPLCFYEKCFIFFLLVSGRPYQNYCFFLVACLFSFTSSGAYYFYHYHTPFQNQIDPIGDRFEILFTQINLNFPINWRSYHGLIQNFQSIGEFAVDQSKFTSDESTVNIEAIY